MAAKHSESDEYGCEMTPHGPLPAPTEEYYGICSTCHGSGTVSDADRVNRDETCWSCGGDGKSELEINREDS